MVPPVVVPEVVPPVVVPDSVPPVVPVPPVVVSPVDPPVVVPVVLPSPDVVPPVVEFPLHDEGEETAPPMRTSKVVRPCRRTYTACIAHRSTCHKMPTRASSS